MERNLKVIFFVSPSWVTQANFLGNRQVPEDGREFFEKVNGNQHVTHAVAASVGPDIVGVFRLDWSDQSRAIIAQGTWVSAQYQRQGVAAEMWRHAFAHLPNFCRVDVHVGTDGGEALARKMMKEYPDKEFRII